MVKKNKKGFTLIEIIIVITTVAIVSVSMLSVLNPIKIKNQAKDAKRSKELKNIKITQEEYFNDHSCYQQTLSLSQDFENGTHSYVTDGTSCPKWYVIFSKLKSYNRVENSCNITSDCLPANYEKSWTCVMTDNYNCAKTSTLILPN